MKNIHIAGGDSLIEAEDGLKYGEVANIVDNAMRVMKVRGGFLYFNEYCGMQFVPDAQVKEPPKIEPKKPGRPPKVVEK